MAKIFLIEGPVGAGKSTFSYKLCQKQNAIHLNLDQWMAVLFSADRPETDIMEWYSERRSRCFEQIWKVAKRLIATGVNVVLEIGLIQREQRIAFYDRVNAENIKISTYVLDASRELRRERVVQRNLEQGDTFSMVVPAEIFELASNLWEPYTPAEAEENQVHFIDTENNALE